jgi:hypothetical protein
MTPVAPTMQSLVGSIHGVVRDAPSGDPVAPMLVVALDRTGAVERTTTTDAAGHYRLADLRAGDHYVGFFDPGGYHLATFHPGARALPASTAVHVAIGDDVAVDADLERADDLYSGSAITGTVTDDVSGTPVPGAIAVALGAGNFQFVGAATADGSGHFALHVGSSQSFVVGVFDPNGAHAMEWYDDQSPDHLGSAAALDAPADVSIALRPTRGGIAGTIVDETTGDPVVGAWAISIGPDGQVRPTVTDDEGEYQIDDLAPGTYRVTVLDPVGGRAQEYVDGQSDYASADPITVSAGATARANATLARPVETLAMGGTGNTLGNDPEQWSAAGYERPYFWLNVAAPKAQKANGDQYTSGDCTGAYSGCVGATNTDFSESGYVYRVSVGDHASGQDLHVQVFDPAFVNVGNTCTNSNLPSTGSTWTSQAATLLAQGAPADAVSRYARGSTQWCVADTDFGGDDVDTTYLVRQPDATPDDPFDNPVVCAKTFGHYDEAVYPLLNQSDGYRDGNIGPEEMPFVSHFRRWTDVCRVPAAAVVGGDYFLQVTTTADQSAVPGSLTHFDPMVSTGGHNKYAVRAGVGGPGSPGFAAGIGVSADGRLPVYVNQSAASAGTSISLARVPTRYAGRTLEVDLFDVADGANASLTVVAPPDSTGSPIAGCTFTRDASPPVVTASPTCTLTGITNVLYNGRTVTAAVPLPDDYRCETSSAEGCRFRLRLDFGSGAPTDQSTWTARIR